MSVRLDSPARTLDSFFTRSAAGDTFTYAGIRGFLTAVVRGPAFVPRSEWLDVILHHSDEEARVSLTEASAILESVDDVWRVLDDPEEGSPTDLAREVAPSKDEIAEWTQGFARGWTLTQSVEPDAAALIDPDDAAEFEAATAVLTGREACDGVDALIKACATFMEVSDVFEEEEDDLDVLDLGVPTLTDGSIALLRQVFDDDEIDTELNYERFRGFLFAVACGPVEIAPDAWISDTVDLEALPDRYDPREVIGALIGAYGSVVRAGDAEDVPALLAGVGMNPDDEGKLADWSHGFILGLEYLDDAWEDPAEAMAEDDLENFHAALISLSVFADPEHFAATNDLAPKQLAELQDAARTDLAGSIVHYATEGFLQRADDEAESDDD